jgi:hypothetical protein
MNQAICFAFFAALFQLCTADQSERPVAAPVSNTMDCICQCNELDSDDELQIVTYKLDMKQGNGSDALTANEASVNSSDSASAAAITAATVKKKEPTREQQKEKMKILTNHDPLRGTLPDLPLGVDIPEGWYLVLEKEACPKYNRERCKKFPPLHCTFGGQTPYNKPCYW